MKQYSFSLILLTLLSCTSQPKTTEPIKDSVVSNAFNEQKSNTPPKNVLTKETAERLKALTEKSARELQEEALDDEINTSIIKLEKYKNDPYTYKHLKKIKSVTSYPDFFRKFFRIGSNIDDLLAVQGEPDDRVSITNSKKAWYYGNCEVIILNNEVKEVRNDDDCLKFCDTGVLSTAGGGELFQLAFAFAATSALREDFKK